MTRKCNKCNKIKSIDEFYKNTGGLYGTYSYCKPCKRKIIHKWKNDNPEWIRNHHLMLNYNMTIADYKLLLIKQNNSCAICLTSEIGGVAKYFHIDHDHITGKIRGLLCSTCNTGIGMFKDSISLLDKTILYLKKANQ